MRDALYQTPSFCTRFLVYGKRVARDVASGRRFEARARLRLCERARDLSAVQCIRIHFRRDTFGNSVSFQLQLTQLQPGCLSITCAARSAMNMNQQAPDKRPLRGKKAGATFARNADASKAKRSKATLPVGQTKIHFGPLGVMEGVKPMNEDEKVAHMLPDQTVRPKATLSHIPHLLHGFPFNPVWMTLAEDPRVAAHQLHNNSACSAAAAAAAAAASDQLTVHDVASSAPDQSDCLACFSSSFLPIRLLGNRLTPTRTMLEALVRARTNQTCASVQSLCAKYVFHEIGTGTHPKTDDNRDAWHIIDLVNYAKTNLVFVMLPRLPPSDCAASSAKCKHEGGLSPINQWPSSAKDENQSFDFSSYSIQQSMDPFIYVMHDTWPMSFEPVVHDAPSAQEPVVLSGMTSSTPRHEYRISHNDDLIKLGSQYQIQMSDLPEREQLRSLKGNTSALLAYRVRQFVFPKQADADAKNTKTFVPFRIHGLLTAAQNIDGTIAKSDDVDHADDTLPPVVESDKSNALDRLVTFIKRISVDAKGELPPWITDLPIRAVVGHADEKVMMQALIAQGMPLEETSEIAFVTHPKGNANKSNATTEKKKQSRGTSEPEVKERASTLDSPVKDGDNHAPADLTRSSCQGGKHQRVTADEGEHDYDEPHQPPASVANAIAPIKRLEEEEEGDKLARPTTYALFTGTSAMEGILPTALQETAPHSARQSRDDANEEDDKDDMTIDELESASWGFSSSSSPNNAQSHSADLTSGMEVSDSKTVIDHAADTDVQTDSEEDGVADAALAASAAVATAKASSKKAPKQLPGDLFYASKYDVLRLSSLIEYYKSIFPILLASARTKGVQLPIVTMEQHLVATRAIGVFIDDYNTVVDQLVKPLLERCKHFLRALNENDANQMIALHNHRTGRREYWPNPWSSATNNTTAATELFAAAMVSPPVVYYLMDYFAQRHKQAAEGEAEGYFTPAWMIHNKSYHKVAPLSGVQHEQLLDAYYWSYLARERRPEYLSIIKFYRNAGVIVKLKNPYNRSGVHKGRCSASGVTRRYAPHRIHAYAHDSLYTMPSEEAKPSHPSNAVVAKQRNPRKTKSKYVSTLRQPIQTPFAYAHGAIGQTHKTLFNRPANAQTYLMKSVHHKNKSLEEVVQLSSLQQQLQQEQQPASLPSSPSMPQTPESLQRRDKKRPRASAIEIISPLSIDSNSVAEGEESLDALAPPPKRPLDASSVNSPHSPSLQSSSSIVSVSAHVLEWVGTNAPTTLKSTQSKKRRHHPHRRAPHEAAAASSSSSSLSAPPVVPLPIDLSPPSLKH